MKKMQLTIPEPCHENWEQMSQRDKGKFCTACQKTVVDFTGMSDRQLAEFFKKPQVNVCGRFRKDQLNTDLDPATRKRIPWIRYFFQFSLPAFFIISKANAQGRVAVRTDSSSHMERMPGKTAPLKAVEQQPVQATIKGQVVDEKDLPISYATVMVKGSKSEATMSDLNGKFTLVTGNAGSSVLVISTVGYESREVTARDSFVKVVMKPAVYEEMGLLIVVPSKKPSKPIPLIRKVMDTAFKKFSVYPNPAPRNSEIRIDMKKIDAGAYTISVIDMAGVVVQTDEVTLAEKGAIISLRLNDTAAGTYFIHVFNRKTAASYNEKITVQ